eukprot:1367646-Amorphochlora_amoeboformis.AAC.1
MYSALIALQSVFQHQTASRTEKLHEKKHSDPLTIQPPSSVLPGAIPSLDAKIFRESSFQALPYRTPEEGKVDLGLHGKWGDETSSCDGRGA